MSSTGETPSGMEGLSEANRDAGMALAKVPLAPGEQIAKSLVDLDLTAGPVRPLSRVAHWKNTYGHAVHSLRLLTVLLRGRATDRTHDIVLRDYDRDDSVLEWNAKRSPWLAEQAGRWVLTDRLESHRIIVNILHDVVQRVHAKRLLEFGCGEGLNIGLYWKLFPTEFNELAWAGFDYSPERSRRTEALLKYFYQLPNVLVWDGDAATRQVKPDYVDLAYSVHVLEQMPHHWQNALLEMRSAAKHVLLVEPIYERKSIGGKLHSRVNGYFRGSIREILDLGFELVREYDFPLRDPFNPSTALLLKRIGRSDESPITSED